ncbi:dethiobiotin synthase [Paenibacillus guangzhouensis]|uniref:dethiobiotin synthase n=1 Tax=Paenibacillus guangzhouensis TaxID=1473112 RepID=UPI0012673F95|nr:dethiobiotin synthase [Paenibacillus guangzhouensis]
MNNKGLFITGTDTDVGKTQVAYGIAAALTHHLSMRDIRLWKPVQTGVSVGSQHADSYRLLHGSLIGKQQEEQLVSLTLPDPLAPWIAARRSGAALDYEQLVQEGKARLAQGGMWMVEGAGGLGVPLTKQHLMVDLARDLALPLLVVARAGLGTVNHTLQTVAYARQAGLQVAGVILNGYPEGSEADVMDNAMMIETFGDVEVLGMLPWMDEEANDEWRLAWAACVAERVNLHQLIGMERD